MGAGQVQQDHDFLKQAFSNITWTIVFITGMALGAFSVGLVMRDFQKAVYHRKSTIGIGNHEKVTSNFGKGFMTFLWLAGAAILIVLASSTGAQEFAFGANLQAAQPLFVALLAVGGFVCLFPASAVLNIKRRPKSVQHAETYLPGPRTTGHFQTGHYTGGTSGHTTTNSQDRQYSSEGSQGTVRYSAINRPQILHVVPPNPNHSAGFGSPLQQQQTGPGTNGLNNSGFGVNNVRRRLNAGQRLRRLMA